MTIHFNGLFDSQLNITMHTTRLRAHSSLIMMSNHHNARFHGSSCPVELAVNQLPCFFPIRSEGIWQVVAAVLRHYLYDTQFRTHFTSVMSYISMWKNEFKIFVMEYCRKKSNLRFMTVTHAFSQFSIFHISIKPGLTGHWPDISCLFEHSCLSSNKQIFNWIICLDLLTRNLSLRLNALCYFSLSYCWINGGHRWPVQIFSVR